MRLLWLPEVLRAAGLTVHEVAGWKTRGSDTFAPTGGICHATAGSSTSTDAGEVSVLLNGSNSAPPPIAQLYLSRSGEVWVVASGRCNHALSGQPGTPLAGLGNSNLIGIEAQNDNRGQAWPAAQLAAYAVMCAAIAKKMGWGSSRWIAHREHQPSGKTDPFGIDMGAFRAQVSALITGGTSMNTPTGWVIQFNPAPKVAPGLPGPWLGGTHSNQLQYIRETTHFTYLLTQQLAQQQAAFQAVVQGLVDAINTGQGGTLDSAFLLEKMNEKLEALAKKTRDAVADLGEGGAAQVRADA